VALEVVRPMKRKTKSVAAPEPEPEPPLAAAG
jgi:hypothetical protein